MRARPPVTRPRESPPAQWEALDAADTLDPAQVRLPGQAEPRHPQRQEGQRFRQLGADQVGAEAEVSARTEGQQERRADQRPQPAVLLAGEVEDVGVDVVAQRAGGDPKKSAICRPYAGGAVLGTPSIGPGRP